jgi:hypothetical protein
MYYANTSYISDKLRDCALFCPTCKHLDLAYGSFFSIICNAAGILIIRIDAPMYYANISYIKDKLRHYMFKGVLTLERSESAPDLEAAEAAPHWPFPETKTANEAAPGEPPVRYIILDMTPVSGKQSANEMND